MKPQNFFTAEQKRQIEASIGEAERLTSGEIRLHIDARCKGDALACAAEHFHRLGMDRTELRNGVLFYLSINDHKFAVVGDKGIHERVPEDFWDNIYRITVEYFHAGQFAEGISWGILEAGKQLATHFPISPDDINELSNEISY
ncbi:MAG: TPM domain-containing protein [Culturomica sp.]|jgi:uncharacterized membrane protein|nr:TPM domain-containing protein [Culturomica sp.]